MLLYYNKYNVRRYGVGEEGVILALATLVDYVKTAKFFIKENTRSVLTYTLMKHVEYADVDGECLFVVYLDGVQRFSPVFSVDPNM